MTEPVLIPATANDGFVMKLRQGLLAGLPHGDDQTNRPTSKRGRGHSFDHPDKRDQVL